MGGAQYVLKCFANKWYTITYLIPHKVGKLLLAAVLSNVGYIWH